MRRLFQIQGGALDTLTVIFLKASLNTKIVPGLGQDCLLKYPFQLINHPIIKHLVFQSDSIITQSTKKIYAHLASAASIFLKPFFSVFISMDNMGIILFKLCIFVE